MRARRRRSNLLARYSGVARAECHDRLAPPDVAGSLQLEAPRPGEHGYDATERSAVQERPPEEGEGPGEFDAR